ncbi:PA2779 family protein [Arenimonas sp.]|uniref:PA2779 family protein n=1 Tax=Arenimonas sp. TaxID=1872635 RepID=UPI0025E3344C|nr:PA2779 family protein [Arenimonas sp.]
MASKIVAFVLSVALVFAGTTSLANATLISTQQAVAVESRAAQEAQVREALAREDVARMMVEMGVDPSDVDGRIASLSDAELAQLHGQLEELPAGGVLAVLGIVLVVLIVLELTGAIDIFKRA